MTLSDWENLSAKSYGHRMRELPGELVCARSEETS